MRLLVAGGGTGGHLFPGMAVAEEVVRRGGEVLFVGTNRGLEAKAVPAAGYPLATLEVSGLKRMGLAGTLRGLWRLPRAYFASRAILKQFKPDVVLGVGGYASGPMVLAAALAGIPTAIQEQNSVPGITNRILSRLVKLVLIAFDEARRFFPERKIVSSGNPVRAKIVTALTSTTTGADGAPRVLIVGGSQGARAVNDLVLAAVEILARQGSLPAIDHQTGPADLQKCQERYQALGLEGKVQVRPFIDDMATAYHQAALVVARAGALTLAELAIAGKPSVLIPLPTAADDHQTKNAARFAEAGAAVLLKQQGATGQQLADLIGSLAGDCSRRQSMAQAAGALARPDAAHVVVDRLEELVPSSPAQ